MEDSELYHFGIKGMKWGVRRYQNKDGSLTEDGKKLIRKEFDPTEKASGYSHQNRLALEKKSSEEMTKAAKAAAKSKGEKYDDSYDDFERDYRLVGGEVGAQEVHLKVMKDYPMATLKDLGIEPTKEALDFANDAYYTKMKDLMSWNADEPDYPSVDALIDKYLKHGDDELQHHGIKGMKWGVRRTKAQLGYKTSPKKKKRSPEDESAVTKAAKKVGSKMSEAAANHKVKKAEKKAAKEEKDRLEKEAAERKKPKNLKDMSDQELAAYFQRLNMEKNVLETQRRISELQPQKVSAGKKYMNKLLNDAVVPAMTDLAKQQITKIGKEALGLNQQQVDSMAALRKEAEKLRLQNEMENNREQMSQRAKRQAKAAQEEAQKNNAPRNEQPPKAEERQQQPREDYRRDDPIPAQNVRVEDVPRETYNTGRDYINGYLDSPVFGYLPEPEKRKK